MKSFRPSVRRIIAVGAAALAGALGALVVATPAFAHHTVVVGQAVCEPSGDSWSVNWTITSFTPDGTVPSHYELKSVSTNTSTGSGAGAYTGDLLGPFNLTSNFVGPGKAVAQPFTGSQTYEGSVAWAKLTVKAIWSNHNKQTNHAQEINKPTDCRTPPGEPKAEFTSNCDGTVTVKLFNESDGGTVKYQVTGHVGDVVVEPGETVDVKVPGNVEIVVTHGQQFTVKYTWKDPANCLPVTGSSLSGVIGAGGALLGLGAGVIALFFVLRRRRTRLAG